MEPTIDNVNPQEIAKFAALAARWWDKESEFKPLHDINPLRLEYIDQRAHIDDKKVLDVGCGGGILAESMAAMGAQVTGIDMGDAPLSVAKIHGIESGIKVNYQKITAEQLALTDSQQFDVITCMELLEHVPNPASTIRACGQLVKPGGAIFFSTINRNPKSYLFAIIGAEYVLRLLPKGTHDYRNFIRPSELDRWAREAKISTTDITGMTYNPITKQYALSADVSVNYLIYSTKQE